MTKPSPISVRFGKSEFLKINADRFDWRDTYHWVLSLSWPQFAGLPGGLGNGGASLSAGMGQSGTLGRLSVPASWPGATPAEMEEAQLVSAVRPAGPTSNAMLNGVPMANGAAGLGRRGGGYTVRYGFRHAVMPRPPIGG